MNLNPDELSDQDWAEAYRDYLYLEGRKAEVMELTFKKALAEVLEKAFGSN